MDLPELKLEGNSKDLYGSLMTIKTRKTKSRTYLGVCVYFFCQSNSSLVVDAFRLETKFFGESLSYERATEALATFFERCNGSRADLDG